LGLESFVFLMALISINLGFINLLPIPMLDGGWRRYSAGRSVRAFRNGLTGRAWRCSWR
jgi:regulator of sigma E protease